MTYTVSSGTLNSTIFNQSSVIISVAHCRLDFTITVAYKFKNTSAMLNVNTTKITIVDETLFSLYHTVY